MVESIVDVDKESYVYVKTIVCKGQRMIAACDEEILGKTFREGKLKLEVAERFYKGVRLSMDEAVKLIGDADIANLSGKSIVDAVLREGLADRRAVISISGIPHLQILKL